MFIRDSDNTVAGMAGHKSVSRSADALAQILDLISDKTFVSLFTDRILHIKKLSEPLSLILIAYGVGHSRRLCSLTLAVDEGICGIIAYFFHKLHSAEKILISFAGEAYYNICSERYLRYAFFCIFDKLKIMRRVIVAVLFLLKSLPSLLFGRVTKV